MAAPPLRQTIQVVETHTCGEPTRFAVLFGVPGATMLEKQAFLRAEMDWLRRALIREPRGHRHMFGGLVTPPVSEGAACGIVWIDHQDYLTGCGHGTIGLGVALVEAGMVPATAPVTRLAVDAPSGRLELEVEIEGGRARRTRFRNVPAYAEATGVRLDVPGYGKVTADIAWGGNMFAIVDAAELGLSVEPEQASALAKAGLAVREAANAALDLRHPVLPGVGPVQIVTFGGPAKDARARYRNTHVFGDGSLDRSPGGTGTSAVMAALHAHGQLAPGETIVAEGMADGLFEGRLAEPVELAGRLAFVPEIAGPAVVTGFHQFVLDPADPLIGGFAFS
jgi:proline racemase/trans-L-3-hydroxyproline dehydratase